MTIKTVPTKRNTFFFIESDTFIKCIIEPFEHGDQEEGSTSDWVYAVFHCVCTKIKNRFQG